jgi:hypothetical protein
VVHPPEPTSSFPRLEGYHLKSIVIIIPDASHPLDFPDGFSCPECQSCKFVTSRGMADHARRVINRDDVCYVIHWRYQCSNASGHKSKKILSFSSIDTEVLKQLPAHIRELFPIYFTHRSAIFLSVVESMLNDLANGASRRAVCSRIEQQHKRRYFAQMRSYLSQIVSYRKMNPPGFRVGV